MIMSTVLERAQIFERIEFVIHQSLKGCVSFFCASQNSFFFCKATNHSVLQYHNITINIFALWFGCYQGLISNDAKNAWLGKVFGKNCYFHMTTLQLLPIQIRTHTISRMCRLAEMPKMLFVSLTADSIAATFLQYEWYFEKSAFMNACIFGV